MNSKSKILMAACLLILAAGCNDNLQDELARFADQNSMNRFAALPAEADLLLCLQSKGPLGKLPKLEDGGRQVGRFGPSTLLVVPRQQVPELLQVDGLKSMVLWGDAKVLEKLDPLLRSELLSAMAMPDWRETEHSIIGTFDEGNSDLKEELQAVGAQPRSVVGGIVTFGATSEIIFDILAWDSLVQLKKPTLLRPSQSLK